MAARLPRRSFATPFVVTFAAACSTSSPPPATPAGNGPPPEPVATAPNSDPSTGPTTPEPVQPTPPETTDPTPVPIHRNPPPPKPPEPPDPQDKPPVDLSRRWSVSKGSDTCHAMAEVHCPTGKPGQPMPSCNPPPAHDYACPSGITSYPITIVMRGSGSCTIERAPQACPPNMHCNPPPLRKVPCPE